MDFGGWKSAPAVPTIDDMLKLFVVGESSSNPDEWNLWIPFVLARDEKEARRLTVPSVNTSFSVFG